MGDYGMLLLAAALLLGNAFFVGAEFALVSARRSQIEPRAQAGSAVARTTLTAMENMPLVIGVNQLGITVCSLVLGAVGEPALAHLIEPALDALHVPHGMLHPTAFALALTVVVYLHVVIGEMVPKNLALAGPDRAALILGPAVWAIATLFRPLLHVINWIAGHILALFGVALKGEVSATYTREEVAAMVEESLGEGLLEAGQYDRLSGALDFVEKDVAAVLMPLESLATVQPGATVTDVEELCAATGYSRFPVADAAGELRGYLHIKDVLETDPERRLRAVGADEVRRLADVAPDALLHQALSTMRRQGAHMARVRAADGSVLGLVTLEDVLEELVGEIHDAAHADATG
ncbi:MAG: hemolysin family protein [Nocardioides sp.]